MKLMLMTLMGLLFLASCSVEKMPFKEGKILAGQQVSASTLNLGYTTYIEYCVQCHGMEGKGDGPAAPGLLPPPRNFTQGLYKFPWTAYGDLPHDEDLARIIRHGLNGTAMLPWDISDERLHAVIQYIKTFAPQTWEGQDKAPGARLELAADPFGEAKKAEAIARGAKVYHVTAACTQCHRGFATKAEINGWAKELGNPVEIGADLYQLKAQDGEYNYKILPPDFTYHQLRSITDLHSLTQRIMYGVTGSGMPGFKDVVSDEDIWALAYYVQDLREIGKDIKKRQALIDRLK